MAPPEIKFCRKKRDLTYNRLEVLIGRMKRLYGILCVWYKFDKNRFSDGFNVQQIIWWVFGSQIDEEKSVERILNNICSSA